MARKKLNCFLRLACFTATTSRVRRIELHIAAAQSVGCQLPHSTLTRQGKRCVALWIQALFAVDPKILHKANKRFLPCSYPSLTVCCLRHSRQMWKKTRAVAVHLLTSTVPFGDPFHLSSHRSQVDACLQLITLSG